MPTIQWVRCPWGTTRQSPTRCRAAPRLAAVGHAAPVAQTWHGRLAGTGCGEAWGVSPGGGLVGGQGGGRGEDGAVHWGTGGRDWNYVVYTGADADAFVFVVCDGTGAAAAVADRSGGAAVGNTGGW